MAVEENEMKLTPKNLNVENQQMNVIDVEELAKEIMKLLKQKLRVENERLPR